MIIDKILGSGIKLWLRSQFQKINRLYVKVSSKDRQILKGSIPEVTIVGTGGLYHGVYVTDFQLLGTNLYFNLPDLLKNKPLKLLETVTVQVSLLLSESDLVASLSSPLIKDNVVNFLNDILLDEGLVRSLQSLKFKEVSVREDSLIVKGIINDRDPIAIAVKLRTIEPNILLLSAIAIRGIPEINPDKIFNREIFLGESVTISNIKAIDNKLVINGNIEILP